MSPGQVGGGQGGWLAGWRRAVKPCSAERSALLHSAFPVPRSSFSILQVFPAGQPLGSRGRFDPASHALVMARQSDGRHKHCTTKQEYSA